MRMIHRLVDSIFYSSSNEIRFVVAENKAVADLPNEVRLFFKN